MDRLSLVSIAASHTDAMMLEQRGEEIIGYAIAALLDTFSRRRAVRRIAGFGLSPAASTALLAYIERDPEIRIDLARRFLARARIAGLGCVVAIALAFVPSRPKIYVGVIAVGGVYCVLSLSAWRRYSRSVAE